MLLTLSPQFQARLEYEQTLLERAKRGEDMREAFLWHLEPAVRRMAARFYTRLSHQSHAGNALEVGDLVQSAFVCLLVHYHEALTKERPFGWLIGAVRLTMRNQVNGRSDPIRRHPSYPPVAFLRLDAPLGEQEGTLADLLAYDVRLPAPGTEQAFAALECALHTLPDKHRLVIERHFGLHGHAPVSLNQIGRELSPSRERPAIARKRYHRALSLLRQTLAEQVTGGAPCWVI